MLNTIQNTHGGMMQVKVAKEDAIRGVLRAASRDTGSIYLTSYNLYGTTKCLYEVYISNQITWMVGYIVGYTGRCGDCLGDRSAFDHPRSSRAWLSSMSASSSSDDPDACSGRVYVCVCVCVCVCV